MPTSQIDNHHILIMVVDLDVESATLLKYGQQTDKEMADYLADYYQVTQVWMQQEQVALWIDLSAEVWALSNDQQVAITQYIVEHALNSTVYQFAKCVYEEDQTAAKQALHTLLENL